MSSTTRCSWLAAALVGFGSVYNAVTCWTAFWGLPDWRWWLMFVAPAAGLLGVAVAGAHERGTTRDRLVGLALQLVLAVPALLLLAAGVATRDSAGGRLPAQQVVAVVLADEGEPQSLVERSRAGVVPLDAERDGPTLLLEGPDQRGA